MVRRMANDSDDPRTRIAEAMQRALVEIALQAYEEAGLSGLCADGRWEAAIGAMRSCDVQKIVLETEG